MSVYVQLGAGAGDRDERMNCRDGFTEYVKSLDKNSISRILLVEANPLNIKKLMECWEDYPQAEIYNLGIVPSHHTQKAVNFFYCEDDAPNYQTCSIYPYHVRKHYGDHVTLKQFSVGCVNINEFNSYFLKKEEFISLYAVDIEGIDAEIVLELDFDLIDCEYFSFEYLYLDSKQQDVLQKMRKNNYIFDGIGVDINRYDWMFRKTRD